MACFGRSGPGFGPFGALDFGLFGGSGNIWACLGRSEPGCGLFGRSGSNWACLRRFASHFLHDKFWNPILFLEPGCRAKYAIQQNAPNNQNRLERSALFFATWFGYFGALDFDLFGGSGPVGPVLGGLGQFGTHKHDKGVFSFQFLSIASPAIELS